MSAVTVIVPSWNRRDLLLQLVGHLRRQTQPIEEVLVVDNGSEDDSAEAAEAVGARVIRMGENAGFARAVNRGIAENRTPWLAIVNNDVEPAPDWLARLVAAAAAEDAWFATGKLLSAADPGRLDGTYDLLCRGGCAWRAGNGFEDGPEWNERRRIRFAPLTAAVFRAELFERLGALDERFESYLEDVDFGLRCALAGCAGLYVPEAVAYHTGSVSLGRWHGEMVRRIARNQLFLVAKHYPASWLRQYGWPVLVAQGLWGLVALRHGAGLAWLRGKMEGLASFRGLRAAGPGPEQLKKILEEAEAEIRERQTLGGFDVYWRLYFALT